MLRAAPEGEHEEEDLIDLTEANEFSSIIVNKRMDEEEVASASSSPYKRRRPLQHPNQSTAVAIARSKGDEPIILIDSSSDSEDITRRRRAESRALWMAGSSSSAARGGIINLTSPASSVCKDGDSSLKDDGKGPNTPSHQSTRRRRRSGGMGRRSSDSMVVLLLDDDDEEEEKDSPPARPVRVRMAKRQSGGGGEGSLLSDEILEIDDDDDEEKGDRQMEDGKVALHLFDEEDDDGDVLAALADGEEEEDEEEQSEAVSSLASSNSSSGSGSAISSSSCSSSSVVHSRGGGGGLGLRSVAEGEEKEQGVDDGLEQLKATELRAQLRLMGVTSRSQRKADMLALLRQTLRSKRLAPFPSESTDRFTDTRGKVIKANLPHGPNGHALCRLCGEECPKKANTFCSKACVHQHRLRSDASYVRKCLLVRDRGICKVCGLNAQALYLKVRRECDGGNRRGGGSKDEMKMMQATVNSVLEGTKLEGKVLLRGLAARQKGRTLKGRPRRPLSSGLFWHADHIVAVIEGGGLQGLENFRTLCVACHYEITKEMLQGRRRQQQQQSDQAVAKTGGGAFAFAAAAAAGEGVALAEGGEALAFAATAGGGGEGPSSVARLDSCASSSSSSSFVSISTESPPSLLALYGEGYTDRIAEALSDAASTST